MGDRPGEQLATRPLHFVWIADCSTSMAGDGKIQALNSAIRQAIAPLRDVARRNPYATMFVRALAFSTGVRWHIRNPTPVEQLAWPDLQAAGYTDMGAALAELAGQLRPPNIEPRALPPALVLVSDGMPTDDFQAGLEQLLSVPWGAKAVRLAIAIGRDANLDVLDQFIGNPDIPTITANDPEQLLYYIKWASTVAVKVASMPKQGAFEVPTPPVTTGGRHDVTW